MNSAKEHGPVPPPSPLKPAAPPRQEIPAGGASRRGMALWAGALVVLAVMLVLSLAVGARALSPGQVWDGLRDAHAESYPVVHQMRLPRTWLGLLVGAALGVAGGVMQALTRNPLADPGLLGINAGASAAVVLAVSALGVTNLTGYVWFAFAGAAAASVLGWLVGGGRRATPMRLVLAGAAINAALYSYVAAAELLDTGSLDRMRFWTVGSMAAAQPRTVYTIAPFVVTGLLLAVVLGRPLNALALGDDAARALGSRPGLTRAGALTAVTLLCGAATAACGPLVFLGLMVPHLVRPLTGPSLRRLLPLCALLAPALLLAADVLGRVLARPAEIQVGVVTAVLGGPFFLLSLRPGKHT